MIIQMLYTLFCTIFFCLGWRIITDEGQILYFLRKPFEKLEDQIYIKKDFIDASIKVEASEYHIRYLKDQLFNLRLKYFIAKPLILCITCFSSIWGLCVFATLNGISVALAPYLIINCLSAAFIQTFIWNLFNKISNA